MPSSAALKIMTSYPCKVNDETLGNIPAETENLILHMRLVVEEVKSTIACSVKAESWRNTTPISRKFPSDSFVKSVLEFLKLLTLRCRRRWNRSSMSKKHIGDD